MSTTSDTKFSEDVKKVAAEEANSLALAIDNPGVVAEKVAERVAKYILEKYPERARTAFWVNVSTMERDQGMEVYVYKRDIGSLKNVRLSALLGRETWGGGIFADVWQGSIATRSVVASVGLGAVKPYEGGAWGPVVGFSIKF